MSALKHKPTPEQANAIAAARDTTDNLMLTAYAGCAKSSTLEMIAHAIKPVPAVALAFNVKIKKELEGLMPKNFDVLTLNGLGHRAWAKCIGKRLTVDGNKLGKLVTAVLKENSVEDKEAWDEVRRLTTVAMNAGIVPSKFPFKGFLPDTKEAWADVADNAWCSPETFYHELARSVLIESIKLSFHGEISFDDQIYMSVMFGGVFPKYPLVLCDEAQDLSPMNHVMLKRTATDRLIVAGDPKQAIYAFRGADSASMGKIRALRSNWQDLPLTLTFRCPTAIVARQQHHAPGYTAAERNAKGRVLQWQWEESLPGDKCWTMDHVREHAKERGSLAILCRNNAPLLTMAFKLIRRHIGVTMLGRDIGKSLIAVSKKIVPDDTLPIAQCVSMIEDWRTRQLDLARANGKPEKEDGINDRAECLIAVAESSSAENAGQLRQCLVELFANEHGQVVLATGHRAKGLEWDSVIHIDSFRLPSKRAKDLEEQGHTGPLEQEKNLQYVIETRTRDLFIIANVKDFR